MDPTKYKELRKKKNFMYLYYLESVPKPLDIDKHQFQQMLNVWIIYRVGIQPLTGLNKIVEFLDKKFGYYK